MILASSATTFTNPFMYQFEDWDNSEMFTVFLSEFRELKDELKSMRKDVIQVGKKLDGQDYRMKCTKLAYLT